MAADPVIEIVVQDQQLKSLLAEIERNIGSPEPFLRLVGEYMLLATDERFENEVDPSGIPWLPNSARTRALKQAQGRIDKVLQSTGIGRASIRYQVYGDRMVFGTPVKYMRKHQKGEGVPQRVFLGVNADDLKEIIRIGEQYLLSNR